MEMSEGWGWKWRRVTYGDEESICGNGRLG